MKAAFSTRSDLRHPLFTLILFGVVFGYVEAAAVVYIRQVYEPIHQRLYPETAPDDLFPMLSVDDWSRAGPAYGKQPVLEITRELGTLLLVAVVAFGVSSDWRQWFAAFTLTFGVWDLTYYLWLKILIGWPRSLLDWDLVFSAPVPWTAPVLAPLLVATVMVATAIAFYRLEALGRPLRPRAAHWAGVLLGGVVIMVAFWWDFRNILAGGLPSPFNWPLLLIGLLIGAAAFVHALLTSKAGSA